MPIVVAVLLVDRRRFRDGDARRVAPNVPMVDVVKGDFVDYLQLRGDIRPAKSIVLVGADAGRRAPDREAGEERHAR